MYYTCLHVTCNLDFRDILIAEIAEAGFDTFMETATGFEAFTEEKKFDASHLSYIQQKYHAVAPLSFSFDKVKKENWNEQWEKSIEPIVVDNRCLIRASFHRVVKSYPYEISITPKMSFGTGHHQTTYLMIQAQLDLDHFNKRVMDAGCGTAILSIMASKRNAHEVVAFDIDEWSVINGKENCELNNCLNITILQGELADLNLVGDFDLILANINKNVLLNEIKLYATFLKPGGQLLISGFYLHDIDDLTSEAQLYRLCKIHESEKESWACLLFEKQ